MKETELSKRIKNLDFPEIKTPKHKALLRRTLLDSERFHKQSFWQKFTNTMQFKNLASIGVVGAIALALFLNNTNPNQNIPNNPIIVNLTPKQAAAKELAKKVLNESKSLSPQDTVILNEAINSTDLSFDAEMKINNGKGYSRVVFKGPQDKSLYFAADENNQLVNAGETSELSTYNNEKFGFQLQYPSNMKIQELSIIDDVNNIPLMLYVYEDKNNNNKWDNGFVPFNVSDPAEIKRIQATGEYAFTVEVTPDEKRTYMNRYESSKSTVQINGVEMESYISNQGSTPAQIAVIEERGDLYYTMGIIGKNEFDARGIEIISSLKFK